MVNYFLVNSLLEIVEPQFPSKALKDTVVIKIDTVPDLQSLGLSDNKSWHYFHRPSTMLSASYALFHLITQSYQPRDQTRISYVSCTGRQVLYHKCHLKSHLYDQAQAIARCLHRAIPRAFPKPINWNKIRSYTQNPNNSVHYYYNQFQIIFKENSGLQMFISPR